MFSVTELGGQHAGSDRADTRDCHQTLTKIVIAKLAGQFLVDLGNLLLQILEMGMQPLQHGNQSRW